MVRLDRMESKVAKQIEQALIEDVKRLTPEQRLQAFATHSRLMMELYLAGRQLQPRQSGKPR